MTDESLRIERLSLRDALTLAIRLHQQGHLEEAGELYGNILKVEPAQPDALHYLGVLSHQLGRGEEAVRLLERALSLIPDHADAHNNLGNVLREQGRPAEAEAAYKRAIGLAPEHADALSNLGVVLKSQGKLEEAIERLEAAIRLQPRHAGAHRNLVGALTRLGRLEEAVEAARRAVELGSDQSESFRNLSDALRRVGRLEEAAKVVRAWLSIAPDHPIARHQLAAYLGENVPERASDGYITTTFDEFAATFDDVLSALDYRAPALIVEGMSAGKKASSGELEVLDAGCGTGLCGPLLRGYARRLIGVDLSPGMIARARERACYDLLITAELTSFLRDSRETFDLIASADTLVYIGNLAAFFTAAHDRLRPEGELVFTLEHAADLEPGAGYRLEPTGRYSHSRAYLERALADAGLAPITVRPETPRKQLGKPVAGLLVCAVRGTAG
jgi:predicted TPR repeat methyltransferase